MNFRLNPGFGFAQTSQGLTTLSIAPTLSSNRKDLTYSLQLVLHAFRVPSTVALALTLCLSVGHTAQNRQNRSIHHFGVWTREGQKNCVYVRPDPPGEGALLGVILGLPREPTVDILNFIR